MFPLTNKTASIESMEMISVVIAVTAVYVMLNIAGSCAVITTYRIVEAEQPSEFK